MSTTAASLDLDLFCARYLAAWNDRDPEGMAELLAPDVVWSDPALGAPVRGIPAVQEFMRGAYVAFPDLRFDAPHPRHLSVAGDDVAWRWRMRGTMRGPIEPPGFAPTGRAMEVEGVDLWTLRDGRIAISRAYYDMNDVARQLGIVPPLESRAERAMVAMQRLQARVMRRGARSR
jgi:steroid delta-isomerase-like uncharacterized protein